MSARRYGYGAFASEEQFDEYIQQRAAEAYQNMRANMQMNGAGPRPRVPDVRRGIGHDYNPHGQGQPRNRQVPAAPAPSYSPYQRRYDQAYAERPFDGSPEGMTDLTRREINEAILVLEARGQIAGPHSDFLLPTGSRRDSGSNASVHESLSQGQEALEVASAAVRNGSWEQSQRAINVASTALHTVRRSLGSPDRYSTTAVRGEDDDGDINMTDDDDDDDDDEEEEANISPGRRGINASTANPYAVLWPPMNRARAWNPAVPRTSPRAVSRVTPLVEGATRYYKKLKEDAKRAVHVARGHIAKRGSAKTSQAARAAPGYVRGASPRDSQLTRAQRREQAEANYYTIGPARSPSTSPEPAGRAARRAARKRDFG